MPRYTKNFLPADISILYASSVRSVFSSTALLCCHIHSNCAVSVNPGRLQGVHNFKKKSKAAYQYIHPRKIVGLTPWRQREARCVCICHCCAFGIIDSKRHKSQVFDLMNFDNCVYHCKYQLKQNLE